MMENIGDALLPISHSESQRQDRKFQYILAESMGRGLFIHRFTILEGGNHYCRLLSVSDYFSVLGRDTMSVNWTLRIADNEAGISILTNHLKIEQTQAHKALLERNHISIAGYAKEFQANADIALRESTMKFADSIERL